MPVMPTLQTSAAGVGSPPVSTSGAEYIGVPVRRKLRTVAVGAVLKWWVAPPTPPPPPGGPRPSGDVGSSVDVPKSVSLPGPTCGGDLVGGFGLGLKGGVEGWGCDLDCDWGWG